MKTETEIIENEANVQDIDPIEYQTIEPDDIVLDDDSDMPPPETKSYDKHMKCTDKFMTLFYNVVGTLPYASILKNGQGDSIKLIDLVKYVEAKKDRIPINEIDKIISFIANVEFNKARPLMELMESAESQKELFQLLQ